jgi:hypothetical protein
MVSLEENKQERNLLEIQETLPPTYKRKLKRRQSEFE